MGIETHRISLRSWHLNGSLGRTRTYDMLVNSEPLYQLSYQGIIFLGLDLGRRLCG